MPQTLTYPGVYIEELPSGVQTITGVATSIAAFVGWAPQGATDAAVLVQSPTDFNNQFGGLTQNNGQPNYLGYAVNQFFNNGGQQSYIIRLVATNAGKASVAVPADIPAFTVAALPGLVNPGTCGVQIANGAGAGQFNLGLYQVTNGIPAQIGSTLVNLTLAAVQASVAGDATLGPLIQIQNVGTTSQPVPGLSSAALYLLAPVGAGFQAGIPAVPPPAFQAQAVASLANPTTYGVRISAGAAAGQFDLALYQVTGGTQTQVGTTLSNLTLATVTAAVSGDATLKNYIQIMNPAGAGDPVANASPATPYMLSPSGANFLVNIPSSASTAFVVQAQNEGQWAASYGVRVVASSFDPTRFTLLVTVYSSGGQESVVESFTNLSVNSSDPQGRFIESVINDPVAGGYIQIVTGSTTGLIPLPNPNASPPSVSFPPYILAGSNLDGDVLTPGTAAFHTALNSDGSGTGGVHLLDRVDIFNLLCVPGETDGTTIQNLQAYCGGERAFYIVDGPSGATFTGIQSALNGLTGANAINSALYFPWVQAPDPLQQGRLNYFPPCGCVAGLYAATDASRGVWKAPAGIDASLTGVSGLALTLTDQENGTLNVQAINCLRNFRVYGNVIWGARTLRGDDQAGSEWKYVPIRRLALFLESSLYDGTQWVVFEPNDETLWSQIRLNVGSFMQGLFLQGAFQGTTPQQAYFVKCDAENNPQSSIDQGVVNVLVGFAPLYPAEFVVIQIQQMSGQAQ